MTTCMYCGNQIADGLKFCTSCGAALPVEALQTQTPVDAGVQQAYAQPSYEQPVQQPYQQYQDAADPNDSGSIGWGVLGFLIPIVGIILYFVWMNSKPKSAQVALIGAVTSIALGVVLRLSGVA